MVIGLTGKICAGKDEVVKAMSEKGVPSIDVDALGHSALERNVDKLVETFGNDVVKDGIPDRKAISAIVFSAPEELEKLNNITHPWMVGEVEKYVKSQRICMINAALLESMGLVRLCDEVLYVFAPKEIRLERAVRERGMSEAQFLSRNESQKDIGSTLFECGKRVITIINDGEKNNLYRQVGWYCDILTSRGFFR